MVFEKLFVRRTRATWLVTAVVVSGLSSCAPDDFSQPIADEPITADEVREGAGDNGHDHSEPNDGIDGDDVAAMAPPAPAVENADDPTAATYADGACRSATGYRSGRPVQICVTTVDGKLVEVRTAAVYQRMRAAARSAGVGLYIVSGFRTMQRQRELYNCYRAGRCPLAARPGYSNHQSGIALDLNTSAGGVYSWLSRNAARYGFRRTVPSEAWHWEYRP